MQPQIQGCSDELFCDREGKSDVERMKVTLPEDLHELAATLAD